MRTVEARNSEECNGVAMAAFLAAGIGSFAMGVFVLMNEAGIFAAPTLYAPTGGVSGRTTMAVAAWLFAWAVLHRRWRTRELPARRIVALTLGLAGLGLLFCMPPVWAIV